VPKVPDVRWISLSHDDGENIGGLADALGMCPSATMGEQPA
jgi:hypothetical protein